MAGGACAVLGSIGRKRMSFALADDDGCVRVETIRRYGSETVDGVSSALMSFRRDLDLPRLPERSAIAVPGLVRGDAVSITNTRWVMSRSGLHSMLGAPPLILNDFAAEAWAFSSAPNVRMRETFHGAPAEALRRPGCYLVVGITSGLGVAAVHRNEAGAVTVLPTEAGHATFAPVTDELAEVAAGLFPGRRTIATEDVISAPGLLAIYNLLARKARSSAPAKTPEAITASAATDPIARAACGLLARAFWAYAGDLVMTFGAWDGLLVTGGAGTALAQSLRLPEAQAMFATSSRHRRALLTVPRGIVHLDDAELHGLAEALIHAKPMPVDRPVQGRTPGGDRTSEHTSL